ncbi:MAG: hypothetical protein EOP54_23145, partial [Sphingobacteriales bacterium]
MLRRIFVAVGISFVFGFSGCGKDKDDPPVIPTPDTQLGEFVASVDGVAWPVYSWKATYLQKINQLSLQVSGASGQSSAVLLINVDTINMLKVYKFEPNGENVARLDTAGEFYTDFNVADAGGTFELTKVDTVNHLFSGKFRLVTYAKD